MPAFLQSPVHAFIHYDFAAVACHSGICGLYKPFTSNKRSICALLRRSLVKKSSDDCDVSTSLFLSKSITSPCIWTRHADSCNIIRIYCWYHHAFQRFSIAALYQSSDFAPPNRSCGWYIGYSTILDFTTPPFPSKQRSLFQMFLNQFLIKYFIIFSDILFSQYHYTYLWWVLQSQILRFHNSQIFRSLKT